MKTPSIPFLIIPFSILSFVYLFVMADNRYTSVSTFSIVVEEQNGADVASGLSAIIGGTSTSNIATQSTLGFIRSSDLLIVLDTKFNLADHYSSPSKDYIFRLSPNHSLEDRLEYYRKKISAKINPSTNLIELRVESYSPKMSLQISQAILKLTEEFINLQNRQIASKQLHFAKLELERSQNIIKAREKDLLKFQNKHKIIQPEAIIRTQLEAIQSLRLQKIQKQIELTTLRASSPRAPSINSLKTTIDELAREIVKQEADLSGDDQQKLNSLLVDYKDLTLNLEFAIQLKKGAEILLESSRAEAVNNTRFFSVIQNPYLPEEEANPRRWYLLISIIILTSIILGMINAILKSFANRS